MNAEKKHEFQRRRLEAKIATLKHLEKYPKKPPQEVVVWGEATFGDLFFDSTTVYRWRRMLREGKISIREVEAERVLFTPSPRLDTADGSESPHSPSSSSSSKGRHRETRSHPDREQRHRKPSTLPISSSSSSSSSDSSDDDDAESSVVSSLDSASEDEGKDGLSDLPSSSPRASSQPNPSGDASDDEDSEFREILSLSLPASSPSRKRRTFHRSHQASEVLPRNQSQSKSKRRRKKRRVDRG